MAERLGIVFYWTGCILAALWVGAGVTMSLMGGDIGNPLLPLAFIFLPAIALWLLGKGLHYIFSGY